MRRAGDYLFGGWLSLAIRTNPDNTQHDRVDDVSEDNCKTCKSFQADLNQAIDTANDAWRMELQVHMREHKEAAHGA